MGNVPEPHPASAQKLRGTLDALLEGFQIVSFDWRYLYVNETAASQGRKRKSELLGHTMMEVYPGIETTEMFAQLVRCMKQRKPVRMENEFTYPDGDSAWFELRIEPVPEGICVLSIDISESKRRDRRLRESEARLRLLLDQLPTTVWTLDGELRFTWAAGSGLAELGMAGVVGSLLTEHLGTDDPDQPAMYAHRRALEGEVAAYSLEREQRTYHVHVQPLLEANGAVAGAVGLAHDVTERHKLEAEFRQAQKMEAVGRLAGGVAHDFNNLLTAITAFTGFARDSVPEGHPAREDLAEVLGAADRAAALTRQLLAFSRRQNITPQPVDLNEVVTGMDKMLRRLLREDVDLITSCPEDLWTAHIDPGAIEQVLVNLVVNARDAMPDGGKLTIQTGNRSLDRDYAVRKGVTLPPGDYVMLAVSDDGVGMEPGVQEHIFEPFFTTKPSGQGTGLGLSTCYGIVKQACGYLWVYSEPGQGTTFRVYLPRHDTPAEPLAEEDEVRVVSGDESILVVEDEDAVRAAATRALEARGYQVLAAGEPVEALEIAENSGPIDLLLTDVVLPGMNGRELYRRLSRRCPELQVLYMSGYTDEAIVHRGVLDPGTALVEKPFTAAQLARRVRQLLDRRG